LDIGVAQDATFASHGEWFGVVARTPPGQVARTFTTQRISDLPRNWPVFVLSFEARNGEPGFDSVLARFSGYNADGSHVSSVDTPMSSPVLSTTDWSRHQSQFVLSDMWDGDSIELTFQFIKSEAIAGTTYVGFLDNIVLEQIPAEVKLAIGLVDDELVLHWPTSAAGYILESTSSLSLPNWEAIADLPEVENGFYRLTLPAEGPARFFRLRRPATPSEFP
jgi:hypothetical protein